MRSSAPGGCRYQFGDEPAPGVQPLRGQELPAGCGPRGGRYLVLGESTGRPIFPLVALGTIVAIPVGARPHHAVTPPVWRWFTLVATLFIVGASLRTALVDADGLAGLWADAFTLPGYAAIAAALAGIVRARRAGRDAGSLSASIVVGTGAVLIAWSFLVVPTLARRAPAFWLLLTAIALVFVGDVGYATSIIGLASRPAAALDAAFIIAYGAVAAAVLHPSVVVLTTTQPLRVRPLLRGRLLTVGAALGAPVVAILAGPPTAVRDRIVLAVGVLVLMGAVLSRTVRAVNQHAQSESVLAVLFLDLDRFKVLHDGWGHEVATSCWSPSRTGCAGRSANATAWHGWAATSSRSCVPCRPATTTSG